MTLTNVNNAEFIIKNETHTAINSTRELIVCLARLELIVCFSFFSLMNTVKMASLKTLGSHLQP